MLGYLYEYMKLIDILFEDSEIGEGGAFRTDEQWLDELKRNYPNWDYSSAVIYHDGVRKKIKNVYCKIHNHSFPERGDSSINVNDQLNKGYGCRDCAKESQAKKVSEKLTKTKEQWKKELSNIEHLKNKCDFSKSKISNSTGKPIVTNIYCKKHKKFFNGGNNGEGTSAYRIANQENICPDCINDNFFEKRATSFEDWIDKFKFNVSNKNYNYSKSEVWYENKLAWVNNIVCNVKGLNGKKHGLFAEDGVIAVGHAKGQGQCPKCECESKQKNFIEDSIKIHKNKYLYDKVDFCDDSTIIRKQGLNRTLSHRKVLIGCNKPNHGYFFQYAAAHKSGSGCPICRESKGELYIAELLSQLKIKFVREKKFNETGAMEFDFYIPKLKVLIEYDGEGHFRPVFGSTDYSRNLNYNNIYKNDNLKNNFIKSNPYGIKLIRVPYTMEYNQIDVPLLESIKNAPINKVTYIGEYPNRQGRKEPKSQFKLNESNLSFENILKQL